MNELSLWWSPLFAGIGFLHASVGMAGGTSYIAILSLTTLPLPLVSSLALTMNALNSTSGSWQFFQAGHFYWRVFLPCMLGSVPCTYLGSQLTVRPWIFYGFLASTLVVSIIQLSQSNLIKEASQVVHIHPWIKTCLCLALGSTLGLISGSLGIGGGIYLIPALILLGLARPHQAAAVGVVFIWVNSMVGLIGRYPLHYPELTTSFACILCASLGASAGAFYGVRSESAVIKKILQAILVIAFLLLMIRFFITLTSEELHL